MKLIQPIFNLCLFRIKPFPNWKSVSRQATMFAQNFNDFLSLPSQPSGSILSSFSAPSHIPILSRLSTLFHRKKAVKKPLFSSSFSPLIRKKSISRILRFGKKRGFIHEIQISTIIFVGYLDRNLNIQLW